MELFIIPAMRFPKTVVELSAIPALIIIPRKLKIWPFNDLSIGSTRINASVPTRTRKKEMVLLVTIPLEVVVLNFLKAQALKNNRMIRISKTTVGSKSDLKMLNMFSILFVNFFPVANSNNYYNNFVIKYFMKYSFNPQAL